MAAETTSKTHLLVTGVARSGTTALSELLNSHSRICLGVERFKFQFLRANNYDRGFFQRDRFFDFQRGDTNLAPDIRPAWKPLYDQINTKWENARVVGDKVPDMIPVLMDFMTQNPDFKYICLLRNLKDVGLSWQARANRAGDSWPAGKGFERACQSWENQNRILHDILRNKALRRNVLLLDYDNMYKSPDMTRVAILTFLDLPEEPAFAALLDNHAEFFRNRKSRRVPKGYMAVYGAVDQSHVRGLRKVAREQQERWAQQFEQAMSE